MSQIDWARLAAFIDGEGHIQIGQAVHRLPRLQTARTRYEYINVVVVNTDPRLISWIVDRFGGRIYSERRQKEIWKDTFRWNVACTQAGDILRGCLPYFVMKREQAEIALAMQATMKRVGVRGTPANVIEHRTQLRNQLKALTMRGSQTIEQAS